MATANGSRLPTTATRARITIWRAFVEKLKLQPAARRQPRMGGFAAIGYAMGNSKSMAGLVWSNIGRARHGARQAHPRLHYAGWRTRFGSTPSCSARWPSTPNATRTAAAQSPCTTSARCPTANGPGSTTPSGCHPTSPTNASPAPSKSSTTCTNLVPDAHPSRQSKRGILRPECREKLASAFPDGRWVRVANSAIHIQGDNPAGLLGAAAVFYEEAPACSWREARASWARIAHGGARAGRGWGTAIFSSSRTQQLRVVEVLRQYLHVMLTQGARLPSWSRCGKSEKRSANPGTSKSREIR